MTIHTISRTQEELEELTHNLGSVFADRAREHDDQGSFVEQNYLELKEARFFSLAIPQELGGSGLSFTELCNTCRQIARYCGSTALAYAMHSHPVALNVFKFHKGDAKAKATLSKIAANELVIAGTGANDWLASNGSAEKVDGGYLVNAHKRFVSGGPGAQVMVTSVNHTNAQGVDEVLHFSLPFSTEGIRIQNNWNTLGMRGTGSNDVILENVFLPEESVVARRPAGQWHTLWDTILPIALPIIVSAYVGMAEAAYELAIKSAQGKVNLTPLVGAMQNQLITAQLAADDMVQKNCDYQFSPAIENSTGILARKTIAANAVKQAVEIASTIVGGSGFFKGHPLEIIVRDIRAMHFHPLPEHKQTDMSGRVLLNLNPIR